MQAGQGCALADDLSYDIVSDAIIGNVLTATAQWPKQLKIIIVIILF